MENDLKKIKEDAIKTQEANLLDTIKSIELENVKSSYVLIFISSLLVLVKDFNKSLTCINIIFFILSIISIILLLYNLSSKKIKIHADVNSIFVKNAPQQWEEYLNNKHLFLNQTYTNAKDLLKTKATKTKISFVLAISLVILVLINRMFL